MPFPSLGTAHLVGGGGSILVSRLLVQTRHACVFGLGAESVTPAVETHRGTGGVGGGARQRSHASSQGSQGRLREEASLWCSTRGGRGEDIS